MVIGVYPSPLRQVPSFLSRIEFSRSHCLADFHRNLPTVEGGARFSASITFLRARRTRPYVAAQARPLPRQPGLLSVADAVSDSCHDRGSTFRQMIFSNDGAPQPKIVGMTLSFNKIIIFPLFFSNLNIL